MFIRNLIFSLNKNKSFFYFSLFLLSSLIFFIKGIVLALYMESSMYGTYVSIYAISIFIGSIMSFGIVEETIKNFPRLWVKNEKSKINIEFNKIRIKLVKRSLLISPICLFCTYYTVGKFDFLITAISIFISFSTSYFSLYASFIRSTGSINKMSEMQFVRAISSITLVFIATFFNNWGIVFLFDALASLISLVNCWLIKKHLISKNINNIFHKRGGLLIYFSYILTSLPSYFDKFLIGKIFGFSIAASFSVHLILVQVSTIFCNIISQKVGPDLIKLQFVTKNNVTVLWHLLKWVIIFFLINTFFIIFFYSVVKLNIFPSFSKKYSINNIYIIICGFIAFLQVTSLIEFLMISLDKEKYILIGSVIFFLTIITSFLICFLFNLPLLFYLLSILFSKLLQFIYQISKYNKFIFNI